MARSALACLLLTAAASLATAPSTAACTGGTAFDWAVAHTRGGIVRGVVTGAETRVDFTQDVVLASGRVLRGDPPTSYPVHGALGMPCEQTADDGETILILYDIRGAEPPMTLPLFYVVRGADALGGKVVVDALSGTLPATDTVADGPSQEFPPFGWTPALLVTVAALLGGAIAIRRWRLES